MRVLVTGVSGFLGWNLALELARQSDFDVVGTHGENPPPEGIRSFCLDLEDGAETERLVREIAPDAVVHCAAISAAGACEKEPERARRVNSDSVGAIGRGLSGSGAYLLFCSTDLVFDGTRPPYGETDRPTPRNVYGETKLAGERELAAYDGPGAVARLALMYGDGPAVSPSFLGWLDAGLRRPEGVTMFSDEIRTALYVADAVEAFSEMIRVAATGTFHLGGSEEMSRADFARVYAEVFGLDVSGVHAIAQAEAPGELYRSPDVSLDISKARRVLGFAPRATREGLDDLSEKRN